MPEGTRVVTILPDSIRNYMTKHLMDEWMWERNLFPAPVAKQNESWYNTPVSSIKTEKVKSFKFRFLQSLAFFNVSKADKNQHGFGLDENGRNLLFASNQRRRLNYGPVQPTKVSYCLDKVINWVFDVEIRRMT